MRAIDRRSFHAAALSAFAGPVIAAAVRGDDAPANTINLGFIGVGSGGMGLLRSFLALPGVRVAAVSDVSAARRDNAAKVVEEAFKKQGKKGKSNCKSYGDCRQLLELKEIDGVVIATPDHWHAILCVWAAQAAKDIYCEKPLAHAVAHGRKVVAEVTKHKRALQTGSQQRSDPKFRLAVEMVRAGRLGKIKVVRVGGVGAPAVACKLPGKEVPEGIDWDLWLGPAARRPYHPDLCPEGVHKHFPDWRKYREYGGGMFTDWGAHHFDIAQWALGMDASGPVKVDPPAREETGLKFTYASGVVMIQEGPQGITFEGSDGSLLVTRAKIESKPAKIVEEPLTDREKKLAQASGPGPQREKSWFDHVLPAPRGKAAPILTSSNHLKNWLDCIRDRKQTICPAEVGHRTATICCLGNIAYWLRRELKWDPAKEQFADDREANTLLAPPMRRGFSL